MMMTMVNTEYIACRECASQCFASHHDIDVDGDGDDSACHDKEDGERAGSLSHHKLLLMNSIKNVLFKKRRRPHIAPSFICSVSCNMLPAHHCRDSHMSFPRSFADRHLSKCVGDAKLEGPSGWLWHATLLMHRSSMVLSSPGWATFAKDHGLQEGDRLVFTYIGQNYFKVRVFGLKEGYMDKGKACMPSFTKFLPCSNACKENEHDKMINAQREQGAFTQENFPTNELLRSSNVEEHLLGEDNEKNPNSPSYNNEKEYYEFDDCDKNREAIEGHDHDKKQEEQNGDVDINGRIQSWTSSNKYLCSDNNQGDYPPQEEAIERAKGLHHSFALNLSNPTVTKLLTISAVHGDFKLVFPMAFVRMHMPSKNGWITLVDSSQKSWQCRWLGDVRTRERLYVCGGWQPFVRAHALKANDVCIFELIDRQSLLFNAYIFKF